MSFCKPSIGVHVPCQFSVGDKAQVLTFLYIFSGQCVNLINTLPRKLIDCLCLKLSVGILSIHGDGRGLKYSRWALCFQLSTTDQFNTHVPDQIKLPVDEPLYLSLSYEAAASSWLKDGKSTFLASDSKMLTQMRSVCFEQRVWWIIRWHLKPPATSFQCQTLSSSFCNFMSWLQLFQVFQ